MMYFARTLALLGAFLCLSATSVETSTNTLKSFDGVIRADEAVIIRSAADGILAEVLVDRGDRVRAGQTLARLGFSVEKAAVDLARARAEATADLDLAKGQLDYAKQKFARSESLLKRGVIEVEKHDEAAHELRMAEIRVTQEQEQLVQNRLELERALVQWSLREIKSPIDGIVANRMRSAGEMVTRTGDSPILEVVRIDPLEVEVRLPIAHYSEVKLGMTALVAIGAAQAEGLPATVSFISPQADAASGTFDLRLRLPNPDSVLPAGLRCQVRFEF